ncbi:MAG: YmdB family metallophosphoesterase [Campylobacterales bacterium]|nr:YmdB family metallophosphoesterase [Campylobacterales bacterium]
MKIAFIGDIVGRPGREIIGKYLQKVRDKYEIDYVIANYENASHGFGLTRKNCEELLGYGIDVMSGGNHSFDKKDIFPLFEEFPLIRPLNYPQSAPGKGIFTTTIKEYKVAVINLMGYYFMMELVDNPFNIINSEIDRLQAQGYKHIIIDMHAETTSEKRTLLFMLKDRVSAILGTHTHVGTDDLEIVDGCCYVTDVGLTGCRDNVLGMDTKIPIERFTTAIGGHFDVPDKCNAILQMVLFELDSSGRATHSQKIKIMSDKESVITKGL